MNYVVFFTASTLPLNYMADVILFGRHECVENTSTDAKLKKLLPIKEQGKLG
jgi:hypothetical protein